MQNLIADMNDDVFQFLIKQRIFIFCCFVSRGSWYIDKYLQRNAFAVKTQSVMQIDVEYLPLYITFIE